MIIPGCTLMFASVEHRWDFYNDGNTALNAIKDRFLALERQGKMVFLGYGRHRVTWGHGRYVYKLPMGGEGMQANQREAESFKLGRWHKAAWLERLGIAGTPQMARCRLLKTGVLVMEAVTPGTKWDASTPDWARYVDCGQVGTTRKGKLVAYDYAE
jgi:hypothetical protein